MTPARPSPKYELSDYPTSFFGSSGYRQNRFLEIVVQWRDDGFHGSDSAATRHNLTVGSIVLL